jgi:hypothetical protein
VPVSIADYQGSGDAPGLMAKTGLDAAGIAARIRELAEGLT